jgi:hypothetical protein
MTIDKKLTRTIEGYMTADGWTIRRSLNNGRWEIFNPITGLVFDSAPTLRELRDVYA